MDDTSIFQGVIEFSADGEGFRAMKTGGGGQYDIFLRSGGAYIRERTVWVRGRATPRSVLAAIEQSRCTDYDDDEMDVLA